MQEKKHRHSRPVDTRARKHKKELPAEPWYKHWLPLLVILPVVFLAFSPILNNELTNWDDPDLIIDNPLIRELSFANIKRIFSEFYFGNYQPLHLVSYSIEYHFWKLDPRGYHAVSLVLFLITTTLVYRFIFLISKRRTVIAVIATLLFAINGMRVESVAWAAERKDMLYALFYVAALIMYVTYIRRSEGEERSAWLFYLLAFLFFIFSVFSKVMAVSLVGALVMLDYLLARKLTWSFIFEKIPFIIVSVILGLVQVSATASTNTFDTSGQFDFFDRILIVGRNLMFYFYKMLLPVDLSAFHPYPAHLPGDAWPLSFYTGVIFGLFILVLFLWSLRYARELAFSIGFFVSGVALVLQFVAIGPALFNERYALIPAIGLSYAIAFYFIRFKDRYPRFNYPMLGVLGIYLMVMFVLTFRRCDVWKDSLTLWDDVLAQYPDASMALNNRGRIYGSELGNTTKALEDLNRAIISDPANAQAYSNRGIVFCMNGKFGQAINDFNRAIHLKKDYYEAFANRGIAFAQTNRPDSALADFDRCLELSPDKPAIYLNRGMCFYQLGKYREAYDDIMKAMSAGLNPDPAWLKQLEAQLGKTDTPANPK